jgi:hypothetical protein
MTYTVKSSTKSTGMINFATKSTFVEILWNCGYSLKVVLHSLKLRKEVAESYPFAGGGHGTNKILLRACVSPDARLLMVEFYYLLEAFRYAISDMVFLKIDVPSQTNSRLNYSV